MTYKIITLKDRLNKSSLNCKYFARTIEQFVLQPSKVLDETTETVVSKLDYKLKPKTSLSKYKTTDFKLENLIECGAVDQLKPTSNMRDNFTVLENIKQQVINIEPIQSTNE